MRAQLQLGVTRIFLQTSTMNSHSWNDLHEESKITVKPGKMTQGCARNADMPFIFAVDIYIMGWL